MQDLVVDTRETWSQVIKRLKNFEDAKLVRREDLPEKYHPHKTLYAKYVNWKAGVDIKRPTYK